MGWIKTALGILSKGLDLAKIIFVGKEREKDRKAGRDEEKVKGFQDAEDTQKRIDAVDRPDDDDVIDILHKGKF